jgi:hypothetical protein
VFGDNAAQELVVVMRTIADSGGIEWTIFEVERQDTAVDRWSHLPPEFADGWLCFESDFSKRRLVPVPTRWYEFSDNELERLLVQAHPVRRIRAEVARQHRRD